MNTTEKGITFDDLIRELEIVDPTETSVGTWNSSTGEMRVAIIHETGHVYAIPEEEEKETDPSLLFRLPVERIGIDAAIEAVENYLQSDHRPAMRKCDMLGCQNLVPRDVGRSVAPGTYLAVCNDCAPIVETVR